MIKLISLILALILPLFTLMYYDDPMISVFSLISVILGGMSCVLWYIDETSY